MTPTQRRMTYQIDSATFDHLSAWCEAQFRDHERDAVREHMIATLERMGPEDAAYSLSHGWWHIHDLDPWRPTPNGIVEHFTDARVFDTYEQALDAAQCMGIAAHPQRCLAKDGWVVWVEWAGEKWFKGEVR